MSTKIGEGWGELGEVGVWGWCVLQWLQLLHFSSGNFFGKVNDQ